MRFAAVGVNPGPACLGVRCPRCGRRGRPRSVPHSAHGGFASRCAVSRSHRVACHKDRGVALAWRRAARPLSRQEHFSSHSIKKESQPRRGRPKSRITARLSPSSKIYYISKKCTIEGHFDRRKYAVTRSIRNKLMSQTLQKYQKYTLKIRQQIPPKYRINTPPNTSPRIENAI